MQSPVRVLARVTDRTGGHTRVAVFVGRTAGARAHAGELTLRNDEAAEIVGRDTVAPGLMNVPVEFDSFHATESAGGWHETLTGPGDPPLSHHDYEASRRLAAADEPFYALIAAAMRRADGRNAARLRAVYPEVWRDLQARYDAPGGHLPGEAPGSLPHKPIPPR